MKLADIFQIEKSNNQGIHLIQDRLFIRAWEKSAFLFTQHFKEYKIHHKHAKQLGEDLLWLGFPRSIIDSIITQAEEKSYPVSMIEEGHWLIKTPLYESLTSPPASNCLL